MRKLLYGFALVLPVTATSLPAVAATQEECDAAFTKADANGDDVLSVEEGSAYYDVLNTPNPSVQPNQLTRAVFNQHCTAGVFLTGANRAAPTEAGAPFEGANSFTEDQARSRIENAGYSNVSNLKKDDKGIWRGTASEGDAKKNVALDYRGNVVAD